MPFSGTDVIFADAVERLREAAQDDRPIDAAQMHLINLQDIIRSAGPTWPLIKDQIRLGSMKFLRGCLDDADIVIPAGDGFLVIFAKSDGEDLKARAEDLKATLVEFYFAQPSPMRDLKVDVEHKRVEPGDLGALVAAPLKPHAPPATDSCLFAPAWSSTHEIIASYFCVPVHRDPGVVRYGYDKGYVEEGRNAGRDYGQLDIAMLDVIEKALIGYGASDTMPAIGISVHSTTMQNRAARAAFLDRLSHIPPTLMKHVYIKIAEIEPGCPTINLADWAGMLRARAKNILLECHHSEATPPNLDEVGVWGAGYQAPHAGAYGATPQDGDFMPHMVQFRRWGDALARQRKRFFVDNVRKAGLVRLAADAGAAFITSDVFWPFQKWPGGVTSASAPAVGPQSGQKVGTL